jgi:hypothetical protein
LREGRSLLVVLESGFLLNQFVHIEKCLIPLQKNLEDLKIEGDAIFHQDEAPCHAAGRVQDFLKENFPALIPYHHMPAGVVWRKEWNVIPHDVILHAIDSWWSRIRRIELADGSQIE